MKTLAIALGAIVVCTVVWAAPTTAPAQLGAVVRAANAEEEQVPWHFGKYYLRYIPHEIVYFNGREADLEHHGVCRCCGLIYITLTDLIRHLSGSIVWGPCDCWVEVKRGATTVRVIPGSCAVLVNGKAQCLGCPTYRKDKLLWVPVQSFAALFGAKSKWNATAYHLDVTF